MKVGDLVKCGDEFAIVVESHWTTNNPQQHWLECLWLVDGSMEGIDAEDVEKVNEGTK
jgi:hypothetical protein